MSELEKVETAIQAVAASMTVAQTASQGWAQNAAKLETLGATTDDRIATIVGQCAYESAGFKSRFENLNYSADGLQKVFGRYFKTVPATAYANQPQKIANLVYADRMGNGDTASGDGYRYRGRGWIQLTGKSNYAAYGTALDIDLVANPDLAAAPATAWLIAVRYLAQTRRNGKTLLQWADANDQTMVTLGINGGTTGLAGRQQKVAEAMRALNGQITTAMWQSLLTAAGFHPGAIDGLPGPETKAAMAAAETKFGKTGTALADALKAAA